MILKSVEIENFKSIENSNEFSIEPITCLVGKNESGKTAILEALYKLVPDIPEYADFDALIEYPRRHYSAYKSRAETEPDNVLTTVWELDKADLQAIEEKLGPKALRAQRVVITKGYDNDLHWEIKIDDKHVIKKYLKSSGLPKPERSKLENVESIDELIARLEKSGNRSDAEADFLRNLQEGFPDRHVEPAITTILKERLPTLLYFSDYHRLPGQVSIDELVRKKSLSELDHSDKVFLALLDLAGTGLDEIDEMDKFEELVAELEAVSNRLSREIFEYWSQNKHLDVEFRFDHALAGDPPPFNKGNIFRIRIKNRRHGVTVSFDERSAGFVWFFSFLVWFSQVKKNYGENLLILLDDPALSLHARAQADLLRYINEKLRPHHQVIYTTHSPFMIDPENILSVRTVEDVVIEENIQGTKVGDKVFSTDADTLFPLQTALGYNITQTLFVGKHTLLAEGPSDLLYLKWFSNELQKSGREYLDPRWVIAPCGGIDKIASFIALFRGSKLNIAVFTDFHGGQKKKVRNLKESGLLRRGHVFTAEMYVDQDEADIEDLLGRSLYISLVNRCYSLKTKSNMLPGEKACDAPPRVIQEVERHFSTLPSSKIPEFEHYPPASFLMENTAELRDSLPDINQALDRFEKLFRDLNRLVA